MEEESVVWDDSYSVNFEIIDNQHKELVRMINTLFLGGKMGKTAADVVFMKAIRDAVKYAETHFLTEEKLLTQVEYPDLPKQKQQHELFIGKVLEAIIDFENGKSDPVSLAVYLKNWLFTHIAECDKKYIPYLEKLK